MHIHTTAATPMGDSLAGFQAAQTAAAARRARELSDSAARLKARSSAGAIDDDSVSFASLIATNPPIQSQTQSQTLASVAALPNEEANPRPGQHASQFQGNPPAASQIGQDLDQDLELISDFEPGLYSAHSASQLQPRPAVNDAVNNSGQPTFVAETQEASRASSAPHGESVSNSTDWLRPVSFWA